MFFLEIGGKKKNMVKSIMGICSAALFMIVIFSSLVHKAQAGDDWKKSEHNWNMNYKDFGLSLRNFYRSDYDHAEVSYKIDESIQIAFRAAEEDGEREYRPKLTHEVWSWFQNRDENGDGGILKMELAHRVEYRHHESETIDDNWRYRLIAKMSANLGDNLSLWGKVQPRWEFGTGKEDDIKIDDIRNQVGLKFKFSEQASFSPYVDYVTDKDFKNGTAIVGTAFTFNF